MTKFFEYNLTGPGWAELTLTSETQSISFEVSYLSDPLSELYVELDKLLKNQTERIKIVFAEEPGEHSLVITKQDMFHMKVEIFENDEWEELPTAVAPVKGNKKIVYIDNDTIQIL